MLNIRQYPIQKKLLWMSLFSTAAALLLAVLSFLGYDFLTSRQSLVASLQTQAQIIGFNSASALLFNDPVAATQTLSALQSSPHIISAGIYTQKGRPFVVWHRDPNENTPLPVVVNNGSDVHQFTSRSLALWHPIVFEKTRVGTVYILSNLQERDDRLKKYTGISIVVLFISFGLAALVAGRLGRLISKAEELLQLQASLLKLVPTAVIVRDSGSRITFFNPAAEELYGWTQAEALGQATHRLLQTRFPVSREEVDAHLAREGRWDGELIHIRRDGSVIIVDSRQSVQRDQDGKPAAVLEINRDITESRKMEEALKQKTQDLERSNKELEQFAYVASHDLQEPLRMVTNYTQMLGRRYQGKLDKDADEFIGFAVDGSKRMQQLINDLLDYSRVGRKEIELKPTSFETVLQQVQINLKVALEESGAVLTHDPLPTLPADAEQLARLFQNLISNAVKYRREEAPRIHIGAQDRGREWRFSVRDNGIGIDPKYFDRIFIIFQRLHTREQYPGTGIGLALCKKIVERHGGRLEVESEPGKGSVFYFTIPKSGGKP